MPKYKLSLEDRFKTKYDVKASGCWEWNGAIRADGYGTLKVNNKMLGAHRYSYEMRVGPIGSDQVLHQCDNRICVNPDHLFLGSHQDNMNDKVSKDRVRDIHGTEEANTSNCQCKLCKDFRQDLPKEDKSEHPSMSTYTKGCRCNECKEAKKLYMREYRTKQSALKEK